MPWTVLREIVLDLAAQIFVDGAASQNSRFDDQWRGVEWLLARTPEEGTPRLSDKSQQFLIYVFPSNKLANTKELWVLYSYSNNQVIIHAACFGVEED